jgi:predicted DNA-binding transcriptional regulator YafY
VREALKSMSRLKFRYEGGSTPGRVREVSPMGLLFGRSNYLVAQEDVASGARNWRLDRIRDIEVLAAPAASPDGFSLQDYADESFGIYHDAVEDVVLEVTPEGAEDALRWRFHANQKVEPQDDGRVIVRFRAAGMRELAWHLFTWGDRVRVRAPEVLRRTLVEEIETARRAHTSGSDAGAP